MGLNWLVCASDRASSCPADLVSFLGGTDLEEKPNMTCLRYCSESQTLWEWKAASNPETLHAANYFIFHLSSFNPKTAGRDAGKGFPQTLGTVRAGEMQL